MKPEITIADIRAVSLGGIGIEIVFVFVAALRTADAKMIAHERVGHAAGWDAESFKYERAKNERKHKSGDNPLECVRYRLGC